MSVGMSIIIATVVLILLFLIVGFVTWAIIRGGLIGEEDSLENEWYNEKGDDAECSGQS